MRHKGLACSLVAVAVVSLAPSPAGAQGFSKEMKKIFTGNDYKGFQWLAYPLDNYGVGTAYRATDDQFLCDTFPCVGLAIPDIAKAKQEWLEVRSVAGNVKYAAAGQGPAAQLSNSGKKKALLTAVLPQLLSIIGIDANIGGDSSRDATLQFASGYLRQLYPVPYLSYIVDLQPGQDTYGLQKAYEKRDLKVVTKDVVIDSLKVSVTSTSKLGLALKAKAGDGAKKEFKDANAGVEVDTSGANSYTIATTTPMIVGVLARTMPVRTGVGKAALPKDWGKWPTAAVPMPTGAQAKAPTVER